MATVKTSQNVLQVLFICNATRRDSESDSFNSGRHTLFFSFARVHRHLCGTVNPCRTAAVDLTKGISASTTLGNVSFHHLIILRNMSEH